MGKIERFRKVQKQAKAKHQADVMFDFINKLENRVKVLEHTVLKASGLISLLLDKVQLKENCNKAEAELYENFFNGLNAGLNLIAGELVPKEEE